MSGLPGQARAEQNAQVPSERMGSTRSLLHTGRTDAAEVGTKPQPVSSLSTPGLVEGSRRSNRLGPHMPLLMHLPRYFLTCSGNVQKPSEARPLDAYSYSGTRAEEERDRAIQNICICRGKEGRGRKMRRQRRHSKDALMQERSQESQRQRRRLSGNGWLTRETSGSPDFHQNVHCTVSISDALLPQIMGHFSKALFLVFGI